MPDIREEKAPKLFQLIQDVQAGISTTDILHNTPDFAFRVRDIDILRQALLAERFSSENRECGSFIFIWKKQCWKDTKYLCPI